MDKLSTVYPFIISIQKCFHKYFITFSIFVMLTFYTVFHLHPKGEALQSHLQVTVSLIGHGVSPSGGWKRTVTPVRTNRLSKAEVEGLSGFFSCFLLKSLLHRHISIENFQKHNYK